MPQQPRDDLLSRKSPCLMKSTWGIFRTQLLKKFFEELFLLHRLLAEFTHPGYFEEDSRYGPGQLKLARWQPGPAGKYEGLQETGTVPAAREAFSNPCGIIIGILLFM